MAACTMPSLDA